jgi:23S rRNA pseudouridine1911/1915/1917 synthase
VVDPLPLPQAVHTYGNFSSMSKARKLIRKGQVLINDRDGNTCEGIVRGGDIIKIVPPEPPNKKKRKGGKDGSQGRGVKRVTVLYEDDDLAVIIKPAGVAVHGTGAYSLVEEYANFLTPTTRGEEEALEKPMHAHRLDAPVGGLLIIAKTKTALQVLLTAFLERKVKKKYQAIVIGRPTAGSGEIATEVEEKEALTHYQVLETVPSPTFGSLSLLELSPETGRKHQLRQHCLEIKTPILGKPSPPPPFLPLSLPPFPQERRGLRLSRLRLLLLTPPSLPPSLPPPPFR